jgi:glycosyltransferase involved in cell wall biosynthesis
LWSRKPKGPNTKMEPKLTIAMSIYNPGNFLEPALQSIFAQTFQDWELILVDDGSDDGSTELLSRIHDSRIRIVRGGLNRGLAARLNQIVRAARAPYIARMDADDMVDSTRLEKQIKYLREHPDVDVVGCGLAILDNRGKPTGVRLFAADHASICKDPLRGILLEHPAVIGKTEWFRNHPYNEDNRTCEDWELWFDTYKTSHFANLCEPLYYYREFSSFSIRKYVDAKCRVARLQWRRRADFGMIRTSRACVSQYIRIALNLVTYLTGLQYYMIRRRSRPIDDATRADVLATGEKISNIVLPLMRSASPTSSELMGGRLNITQCPLAHQTPIRVDYPVNKTPTSLADPSDGETLIRMWNSKHPSP